MILGIAILVLVIGIAFIHFVQGFFSSVLSTIFAIFSAVIAFSFHEKIVASMKPGKFAEYSTGIILCSLYAVSYIILRMIFDRLIRGNVRYQSIVDKALAAVMGLIAGLCSAGVIAVAVQTFPWGAKVLGFSRYKIADDVDRVNVSAELGGKRKECKIYGPMKSDGFKQDDREYLLLTSADDFVISLVNTLSDGVLSGDRTFSSIHQDYLQEAFGQRIGLEIGARRIAVNFEGDEQIKVDKVAVRDKLVQVETSELFEVRVKDPKRPTTAPVETTPARDEAVIAKDPLKVDPVKERLVIVRILIEPDKPEEKPEFFKFTRGSVRLVTHDSDGRAKNYYPLGTMDTWQKETFWPSRIDDVIFVSGEGANGVDLVFQVPTNEIIDAAKAPPKSKPNDPKAADTKVTYAIQQNVFIEVKRMARVDLSGMEADTNPLPKNPAVNVMRKTRLKIPPAPAVTN